MPNITRTKLHPTENFKSLIMNLMLKSLNLFRSIRLFTPKSKSFDKKVIYFGGCGGVNDSVIKILNSMNIEVVTPDFECCGFPFFVRGDMKTFESYIESFYRILEKYDTYDVVVNCATCEKTLKSYSKWHKGKEVTIKNVFEYIKENTNNPIPAIANADWRKPRAQHQLENSCGKRPPHFARGRHGGRLRGPFPDPDGSNRHLA